MIKKVIISCSLLLSAVLFSLPVENPSAPKMINRGIFMSPGFWIQCRIGYEGNYLSDAQMEQKNTSRTLDNVQRFEDTAFFTLSIERRFDVFGHIGAARYNGKWQADLPMGLAYFEAGTDHGLLWEVGAKAIFYEWGNVDLTLGGRYADGRADLQWLTQDGLSQEVSSKNNWKNKNWQIDLSLSYHADIFVPYLGATYLSSLSRISSDIAIADDDGNKLRFRSKDHYGMVVGCGLATGKIFALNLEARFFNEEGVTVSGNLQF